MYTANTFEELHDFFKNFKLAKYIWLYRGQANASWRLKPKAGRDEYNIGGTGLGRFRTWQQKAVAHIDLPHNEWEQLAIAQHHGLATFMLDWSENPLVATFFAVYEYPEKDGIVYVHTPGKILDNTIIKSPFYIEEAIKNGYDDFSPSLGYYPKSIDSRIINQRGVFTIHAKPQEELENFEVFDPNLKDNLFGIIIKAEAKKEIRNTLQKYGIDYHYLFPDLGGLSEYINYETRRIKKAKTDKKKFQNFRDLST